VIRSWRDKRNTDTGYFRNRSPRSTGVQIMARRIYVSHVASLVFPTFHGPLLRVSFTYIQSDQEPTHAIVCRYRCCDFHNLLVTEVLLQVCKYFVRDSDA
jgi:hypothetical protein